MKKILAAFVLSFVGFGANAQTSVADVDVACRWATKFAIGYVEDVTYLTEKRDQLPDPQGLATLYDMNTKAFMSTIVSDNVTDNRLFSMIGNAVKLQRGSIIDTVGVLTATDPNTAIRAIHKYCMGAMGSAYRINR